MPIWLRNFTFKKIKEFYEEITPNNDNNVEKSISAMKSVGADKQSKSLTYITKASKK